MTPELKLLTETKWQLDCSKTNLPTWAVPKDKFEDRTANGLTRCIITWLQINGHQAERINTMGRMIDNRQTYTDAAGRIRVIGSTKYIPTTSTKGSADVSATINGKSVKIEIKVGQDRMSEAQLKYKADIERAGGIYIIAGDFPGFIKELGVVGC